ncbi:hypothetical protein ACSBR2_033561 [Camellia fascicularis]
MEEEEEGLFSRLREDIVLHILNKVSNVKWLCRCSVLSKLFASLIPQVQTVSVSSSCWALNSNSKPKTKSNLMNSLSLEFPVLSYLEKLKRNSVSAYRGSRWEDC